ncbi:hypothetical protein ACJD0Z_01140 [Flavobacteriaceae bacterium M23B6Z8]
MKNILFILILASGIFTNAQEVNGKISISKKSAFEIEVKDGNVVEVFKNFKEGKYPIIFAFEGKNMPKDNEGRGVVLFSFETSLFANGRMVSKNLRAPMPFFPGEMLMPVETFDFIHQLTFANGKEAVFEAYPGKIGKGTYKIVIKAIPVNSKGSIEEVSIVFFI